MLLKISLEGRVIVIVRKEQMDALELQGLEGYLLDHLRRFARDHVEAIDRDNLRQFVRLGIRRAASFGWTKRGPVEFFLEVMVMLGSEFHTDPQYPWASSALGASTEEMAGADHLHAEVMKYYDAVFGPGLCYEVDAIRRLLASDYVSDRRLSGTDEAGIHQLFEWAFPQKYAVVGRPAIGTLIGEAQEMCARIGVPETELALVAGTLFCFGHGCFSDPQYPWLVGSTQVPGARKEAGLYRVLKRYLQEALTNMERG
jgi:hypothetical protein